VIAPVPPPSAADQLRAAEAELATLRDQLAHDLPPPRKLTPDEMEACTEEARKVHDRKPMVRTGEAAYAETATPDPLEAMRERLARLESALFAVQNRWGFSATQNKRLDEALKALGAEAKETV
jgi:hypothetical protein